MLVYAGSCKKRRSPRGSFFCILSIHKPAIVISGGNHSYMLGRKVYKRGHKVKKHARQTDVDKVRYFEIILRLAKNRSRLLI